MVRRRRDVCMAVESYLYKHQKPRRLLHANSDHSTDSERPVNSSCLRVLIASISVDPVFVALRDPMRKTQWLLLVILLTLASLGPLFAREQPLQFTPQNGFAGESEGRGSLRLFLGKPRAFQVTSRGSEQGDGTFRLDQTINFQGEAPQERFWILHATGPNHYAATLSDAAGPVEGVTSGSHLSLRYRVKGPLVMHQELELSADGRTIDNVGVITFFGVPVGRLHETITRKLPDIASGHPEAE